MGFGSRLQTIFDYRDDCYGVKGIAESNDAPVYYRRVDYECIAQVMWQLELLGFIEVG